MNKIYNFQPPELKISHMRSSAIIRRIICCPILAVLIYWVVRRLGGGILCPSGLALLFW